MSIGQKANEDYLAAVKARDDFRVQTLRLLRSELKSKEKDKLAPLTEAEEIAIVRTMVKKRLEAAEAFAAVGKEDRASAERAESKLLTGYLPPELSEEQIDRLIAQAIDEADAKSVNDLGKVMKILMPRLGGAADGKIINQKVRQALTQ